MAVVVDASALVEVVARTERARQIEESLAGREMLAPDFIDAEVLMLIPPMAGPRAHRRHAGRPGGQKPAPRAYAALARRVGWPLLTLDAALRRAPGMDVEVVPLPGS